jgi:hypothetical protein
MSQDVASFAPRVAVLIDAENVSAKHAHEIVKTVHLNGGSVLYSMYGKENACRPWLAELKAFKPLVVSPEPTGKSNAADMTMMLDAMVLLLRQKVSQMYLVSSDADFVPLIRKLRRHKCRSVVFAEKKATEPLKSECDQFILLKKA